MGDRGPLPRGVHDRPGEALVPGRRRSLLGRAHLPRRVRLPQEPVPGGTGGPAGTAGIRVLRRPAGRGRGPGDLLPGEHGPGRHLGRRPRGADRRRHRPRAPGGRGRPLRGRLRQHPPASGVGEGPRDLRGGPRPRRGDGGRPHPRGAAPRHGLRQALRLQLDGERPVPGRHHRRRGRPPRGLPPPVPAHRRRGCRRGDERLQQRERRVVRRQPRPPHRCAPRRVGVRWLRDQ